MDTEIHWRAKEIHVESKEKKTFIERREVKEKWQKEKEEMSNNRKAVPFHLVKEGLRF